MFFLDKAKNYFYHDPELHYLLAYIYYKNGDYKRAEKALNECVYILPGYFPAVNLMEKLKFKIK